MPQFTLNREEMAQLDVPVAGDGGFQALLRRLQLDLNTETGEICVSDTDVARISRYCTQYGQGGWQDRLARAFHRVLELDIGS